MRRVVISIATGAAIAVFVVGSDLQTKDPTGLFRILFIPAYVVGAFASNSIHKPNEPVAYIAFAATLSMIIYVMLGLVGRWRRRRESQNK